MTEAAVYVSVLLVAYVAVAYVLPWASVAIRLERRKREAEAKLQANGHQCGPWSGRRPGPLALDRGEKACCDTACPACGMAAKATDEAISGDALESHCPKIAEEMFEQWEHDPDAHDEFERLRQSYLDKKRSS